jgi:predicted RNA binding protein YcfA (HicA-like mRNA interferase family)
MPQKIRELITNLKKAGFYEIYGAGKGSHRKYTHEEYHENNRSLPQMDRME